MHTCIKKLKETIVNVNTGIIKSINRRKGVFITPIKQATMLSLSDLCKEPVTIYRSYRAKNFSLVSTYITHHPYLVPYASSFVNFAIEELVCIKDLADCEWPQKEWCKRRGDKTKI